MDSINIDYSKKDDRKYLTDEKPEIENAIISAVDNYLKENRQK